MDDETLRQARMEIGRRLGLTRRSHGHSGSYGTPTPTYQTWRAMKSRCLYPKHRDFDRYGGRGITIDPRWLGRDGFATFLADMGERPDGTTLDRIDNDGPYTTTNCRWTDASTQARNQHPRARGYTRRAPAVPVVYGTKDVTCMDGCGAQGSVLVTVARWRCDACRVIAQRAATAKHRAKPGKPSCSEDGCSDPVATRGLCNKHYLRVLKVERVAGH